MTKIFDQVNNSGFLLDLISESEDKLAGQRCQMGKARLPGLLE
jgi:hypothetical protein